MDGKRVLVTGSGTGIGRAVALEFAREGASVVLHYSHSKDGALSAVEEIEGFGRRAAAFQADFRDLDQVRALAERALKFLGGIDVLVNNAGITMNRPFEETTPEQFDTLYDVNVRGPYFLTQAVVPSMVEQGRGVIVNLTSIHAFAGMPEHSVYAGTKGAIVAQTREMAIELAMKGIRVNAIAPGAVPVENQYKAVPDLDPEAMGRLIPVGFAGTPLDIARAAIFLASDDARYIVGQTLVMDGGTTSWLPMSDAFREPMEWSFGKGYVPGI
jgi:NAD(P)-dependent dehydrogenase (short-subunit alcohol dehydrogenase family)